MPHLRLEHTINIESKIACDFFDKLINVLTKHASIESSNCKNRAIKINDFHLDSKNGNENFIHLEINILEGRSDEIKQQIGRESLDLLKSCFQKISNRNSLQISLEIREMKREAYFTTNNL
jgi:5-carboxymethyl-2-hydroxymuconate isomerase